MIIRIFTMVPAMAVVVVIMVAVVTVDEIIEMIATITLAVSGRVRVLLSELRAERCWVPSSAAD